MSTTERHDELMRNEVIHGRWTITTLVIGLLMLAWAFGFIQIALTNTPLPFFSSLSGLQFVIGIAILATAMLIGLIGTILHEPRRQ